LTIRNTRVTKRVVAAVATAALGATLLALPTSPVGATSTVNIVRTFGADREASSVAIASAASTGVGDFGANNTNYVLANSRSFADSATASALAGSVGGTIILLPTDGSLSAGAQAELATAANVWIIGGPAVVPATVEAAVQTASTGATTFQRLGGATRFETMALVANNITAANVASLNGKKTVLLGNSQSFADLVSASPAAYAGDNAATNDVHPVLITPAGSLAPEAKAAITSLTATQVVILGGPAAVSAAVEAEINAMAGVTTIRIQGADRYATAVAFANLLMKSRATGGFGWNATNVGLVNFAASGQGADSLSASAYLGQLEAPMLGSNNDVLPATTTAFLDTNQAAVATLHIFGGPAAVPAEVATAATTAAGKTANPTAVITATEKGSTATVVFSEKVTEVSAELATSYQILGTNGVAFSNIASISLDAAGTSVQITFTDGTQMGAGVTIQVITGTVKSFADVRTVDAVSTVITKDATAPSATLTAVNGTAGGNSDEFKVSFSEPVTGRLFAGNFTLGGATLTDIENGPDPKYTLAGVSVNRSTFVPDGPYDAATINVENPASLTQSSTLAILGSVVTDVAGNANTAASTTVTADSIAPTLTSATVAVAPTATAERIFPGEFLYKAKTAGVTGEIDITLAAAAAAPTGGTVAVDGTTSAITVTPLTGATSIGHIKALLEGSASANALISIDLLAAGNTLATLGGGAAALDGGTSTATVTSRFSENVSVTTGRPIDYSGGGGAFQDADTKVATGNVVVSTHVLTTATQLPIAGAGTAHVEFDDGSVVDIGGNPNAAVTRIF
jgi:putative cell wall-binding protein